MPEQGVERVERSEPEIPAAQAEVYDEIPRGFPVDLGNGVTIHVPPQVDWRSSAIQHMRTGDFDSWAESVLADDNLDAWDDWMDTDPAWGDVQEFFERLGKVTGLSAAPNRASRRASRRTPKR